MQPFIFQYIYIHCKCLQGFYLQYLWKRAVRITEKPYTPQRERLCMLWGNSHWNLKTVLNIRMYMYIFFLFFPDIQFFEISLLSAGTKNWCSKINLAPLWYFSLGPQAESCFAFVNICCRHPVVSQQNFLPFLMENTM